jgi:hypothetical protein
MIGTESGEHHEAPQQNASDSGEQVSQAGNVVAPKYAVEVPLNGHTALNVLQSIAFQAQQDAKARTKHENEEALAKLKHDNEIIMVMHIHENMMQDHKEKLKGRIILWVLCGNILLALVLAVAGSIIAAQHPGTLREWRETIQWLWMLFGGGSALFGLASLFRL